MAIALDKRYVPPGIDHSENLVVHRKLSKFKETNQHEKEFSKNDVDRKGFQLRHSLEKYGKYLDKLPKKLLPYHPAAHGLLWDFL